MGAVMVLKPLMNLLLEDLVNHKLDPFYHETSKIKLNSLMEGRDERKILKGEDIQGPAPYNQMVDRKSVQ